MMTINKNLWINTGLIALNLLSFIVMAEPFLQRFHHHWIVPVFCAFLLIETWWLVTVDYTAGFSVVLGFIVLVGMLLFWRQFSMFQCVNRCQNKLAGGLALLAISCVLLRKHSSSWIRLASKRLSVLLSFWVVIVLGVSIYLKLR